VPTKEEMRAIKASIEAGHSIGKAAEAFNKIRERDFGMPTHLKDFRNGDQIRDFSSGGSTRWKTISTIKFAACSPHRAHVQIQNGPLWCCDEEKLFERK
jgi:hypothetical protein